MEHRRQSRVSFDILRIPQRDLDYLYREKFHDLRLNPECWQFQYFILAFTVADLCIYTHCCYCVTEFVNSIQCYIINHEWHFIALDGIMLSMDETINAVSIQILLLWGAKYQ